MLLLDMRRPNRWRFYFLVRIIMPLSNANHPTQEKPGICIEENLQKPNREQSNFAQSNFAQ